MLLVFREIRDIRIVQDAGLDEPVVVPLQLAVIVEHVGDQDNACSCRVLFRALAARSGKSLSCHDTCLSVQGPAGSGLP